MQILRFLLAVPMFAGVLSVACSQYADEASIDGPVIDSDTTDLNILNGTSTADAQTVSVAIPGGLGYPCQGQSTDPCISTGYLLTNGWVITTRHGVRTGLNDTGATVAPGTVVVTLNNGGASLPISQIITHPTEDVALLQLTSVLSVGGSKNTYGRALYYGAYAPLIGSNITAFGRGSDACTGLGGVHRAAIFSVTGSQSSTQFRFDNNNNPVQHVTQGDSGGALLYTYPSGQQVLAGTIVSAQGTCGLAATYGIGVAADAMRSWLHNALTRDAIVYALGSSGVAASNPAVSSWGPNRLDVFTQGTDTQLYTQSTSTGGFGGTWSTLGGSITSDPASVSWGVNRIDVFARGTDNGFHSRSYSSGWVSGWADHGGTFTSGPAVSSWGSGRLDVFGRDTNGELSWKPYTGSGNCNGWECGWTSLGGDISGTAGMTDPAAVSWGTGRIDVFAVGTDGAMHTITYLSGGGWGGWVSLGGAFTSSPAVASWAPGHLDLFARGTNGALYQKVYDGEWQSDWTNVGTYPNAGHKPTATSWGKGRIDIFYREAAAIDQANTRWRTYGH